MFGGRGEKGVMFNDVHCLDVENWAWSTLPSTTAPPTARFNHAGLAVGTKLVYFGGWDGKRCFDDLWVYDTGMPPLPQSSKVCLHCCNVLQWHARGLSPGWTGPAHLRGKGRPPCSAAPE